MERYSEYKDSGVKWLGEIPSHWEVVRGLAVFSENKNKNTQLENSIVLSLSYGKIIVKKDIDSGLVPEEYSSYQIVKPGFIIVRSTDLQNDKTSLRIGYVCNEGIITSAYLGLQVKGNNNDKYLYYFLHDWDITKEIYRHGNGLRQSLSWNDLRDVNVLLPPLSEQDAIVRYLDSATSKIDKAIAMQQKMIDLLNERKQIIIQNAVTKGLDENVEMKDSGDRWIGLFPSSWTTRRLNFSSWIRARLGWKGLKASEYVDNGYPFLSAFNIVNDKIKWENLNFINKYRYDESPEIKLSVGDILLVKDGAGIGKCARIDELPCGESTANGSLAVITANYFVDYCYLYYFMISKSFKDHTELLINGMGVPHFTQGEMKKIVIPIPSKSEQQAIVAYLDKEMQRFDSAISNCQRQITLLQERKQIIINEVVTGKVKVS